MPKRQFTVYVPQDIYEELQARATSAGTNVPKFAALMLSRDEIGVEAIIRQALDEQAKQYQTKIDQLAARVDGAELKLLEKFNSLMQTTLIATLRSMGDENERAKYLARLEPKKPQ